MSKPLKPTELLRDTLRIATGVRDTVRKVGSLVETIQAVAGASSASRLPSTDHVIHKSKPVNPQLCDGCGNLESKLHRTNGERLERGASLGCPLCTLIRRGLSQYFQLPPEANFYLYSRESSSLFVKYGRRWFEFYTQEGRLRESHH